MFTFQPTISQDAETLRNVQQFHLIRQNPQQCFVKIHNNYSIGMQWNKVRERCPVEEFAIRTPPNPRSSITH